MLTHRRHHFVVQVFDELRDFLLDLFRGLGNLLADARRCIFHLRLKSFIMLLDPSGVKHLTRMLRMPSFTIISCMIAPSMLGSVDPALPNT